MVDGYWAQTEIAPKQQKSNRLSSNLFRVSFDKSGIRVLSLSFANLKSKDNSPVPFLPVSCKTLLHKKLTELLGYYVLIDNFVITPTGFDDKPPVVYDLGESIKVSINFHGSLESSNPKLALGLISFIIRQITDRHSVSNRSHNALQRIGRYFFDASSREDDRQSQVIGGFSAFATLISDIGCFVQVDSIFRAVHRKSVLETVNNGLEADFSDGLSQIQASKLSLYDQRVQMEWRRRCENSIVVATHNNRVYRIKCVRFDLNVNSTFYFKDKKSKTMKELSYYNYFRRFYNRNIFDYSQPLIEAYSSRSSESIILIPEMCAFTGLTEEMRKDRMLMQEVLQHSMVSTTERLRSCASISKNLSSDSSSVMDPWSCRISSEPAVFESIQLDPVEVTFGLKRYTVEDGNFQRWTRNGSQCPVQLTKWIAIYPDQDKTLVDMWLRSMRELGGTGFGMHFSEPTRIVCSGNTDELKEILLQNITPDVQLVMLFTPQKDSRKLYQVLKHITCTIRPCVSQVVKSETMRKRQSIVAVVTRIVMQISAKILGPLWHVSLDSNSTPMMKQPCMLVGIDICQSKETKKPVLGFVASLDAFASHHYTEAVLLLENGKDKRQVDIAAAISKCFRNSLEAFAEHNEGILPTHIVFYRGSVSRANMQEIASAEVKSVLESIKQIQAETWLQNSQPGGATRDCLYEPTVTYVLCMANVSVRFFSGVNDFSSPQPGTVITSLETASTGLKNWYMINQHVARGTAIPTQYFVAFDSSPYSSEHLFNLTFRLSHMYYNFPGSVRLPAPTQYARKLAHLVGTAVQSEIHPRLRETLFYL